MEKGGDLGFDPHPIVSIAHHQLIRHPGLVNDGEIRRQPVEQFVHRTHHQLIDPMRSLASAKHQQGRGSFLLNHPTYLNKFAPHRIAGHARSSGREELFASRNGEKNLIDDMAKNPVGHPWHRILLVDTGGLAHETGCYQHRTGNITANPENQIRPKLADEPNSIEQGKGQLQNRLHFFANPLSLDTLTVNDGGGEFFCQ
ncbi:MAG: hypothetical protein P8130_15495 [Deltaproteobacteria bacterium]